VIEPQSNRILVTTLDALLSMTDVASYRLPRMQERDSGMVVRDFELAASDVESERSMASAGDEKKRDRFTLLMKTHGHAVFAFCLKKLGNRALAEDVQQQVFIEAYRDLDTFLGKSSESTWLFGIARHRCQDANKSKGRRDKREQLDGQTVEDTVDDDLDLAALVDGAHIGHKLMACIDELSAESRKALLMRFRDDMSYEQMASVLDAKADTLRARVARALPLVKRCLATKGVES
jgi:RNA polymerase sigma-70 factor (ECF subfamily)